MARQKAAPKEKKPIVTTKAPDVEALAKDLIERFFPTLVGSGIVYGFFGEGKKQKKFGVAKAFDEPTRTLLSKPGTVARIIVSPSHWRRFNERQREQALHELLCSVSYDGQVVRIEKPDFKGFRANILHFGVEGNEELEFAFRNIQLILPGTTDEIELSDWAATVDPETGEIIPRTTGDGETASVMLEMGDKKVTLTAPPPKTRGKSTGEQKPRIKGADGFGAVTETTKRGATPAGPQTPA